MRVQAFEDFRSGARAADRKGTGKELDEAWRRARWEKRLIDSALQTQDIHAACGVSVKGECQQISRT